MSGQDAGVSRVGEFEPATYEVEIAGSTDGGDRVPDLSPREAVERWVNKLRVAKRESTVSTYHYRLKHFVEWCEESTIETTNELTGWDVESYETHRREQGLEPVSLSNELKTLRAFFEYAARIEVVHEDLPEKVDPPVVEASRQVDETQLKPKDAEALLEHYRESADDRGTRAHALLGLAWFTGARLGALRGLDLEDYEPGEQYVEFVHRPNQETPLKNGPDGERIVGLPAEACEILDEYIRKYRHEKYDDYGRRPLFTSEVGRASTNAVRSWMYLATFPCIHGPCPYDEQPAGCEYIDYSKSSQCPASRSPHQVRTGSVTWQLNKGIPPERVSERVNTSIDVLLRHYDQPDRLEEMRERRRPYLNRLSFDAEEGEDQ